LPDDPIPSEQPGDEPSSGPAAPDFARLLGAGLGALREAQLLRTRRVVRHIDATHVELDDGRQLVSFAGNDYLALSHHPRVIAAAEKTLRAEGLGSGASALISGYTRHHAEAERRIAGWKGCEAAVLLGSGYQANVAGVQALASLAAGGGMPGSGDDESEVSSEPRPRVRFLLDKLVHASLIDAVRGTGLPLRIFPHNGLAKLERLLESAGPHELQVVVTESVFSMDGDRADLPGLAALKRRRPFVLLLDEAHASGVYGPAGAGLAAELGLRDAVDVSVVTLSKALGCFGGAVCGSRVFCDTVVNRGRAYVYATSVPACVAATAVESIDVLRGEPERAARLLGSARRVRSALGVPGPADSPIVPILLGAAGLALSAAAELHAQGFWVPAVRPPTVPRGGSRLRLTLSSAHTDEEVDRLIHAIRRLSRSRNALDG
jgi:8-amino-7-oxononanoate synthase